MRVVRFARHYDAGIDVLVFRLATRKASGFIDNLSIIRQPRGAPDPLLTGLKEPVMGLIFNKNCGNK